MDILKKEWNGIEYYLIDIYETEFSFGIVYHFISDNDEKFCFYKDNTYIPIKNKIYLRKIAKELKVNSDILFSNNPLKRTGNIKKKPILSHKERWNSKREYLAYDEVSKIIHELFPDISYEDTMSVLNDNSGIYSAFLKDSILGCYYHHSKEIHIDNFVRKTESKKRTLLHEAIHKLTNRNGFLTKSNKCFIGLIEGATEKICEDKYGDKTSHTEYLNNKAIHINFSIESTYTLPQIIYRQMAQLVDPKMADKSIINGNKDFFNKFSDLYGKDLFSYLNHRTNRFLKKSLSEKRKLQYLKEAQSMLLTRAFDKKFSAIQTEEDMINYMTELRNFESVTAQIEDDTTFQDYYNSKYNSVIQLAKKNGIDLSKIEPFEHSGVDFYPERKYEKSRPFEIVDTHTHTMTLLDDIKQIDFSKCSRIQVEPSPNFFDLDIVLQDGIPISIVNNDFPFAINLIDHNDEYCNFIRQDFKIEEDKVDFYNIAQNTYMIIKPDGTSDIYSKSSKTGKIYNLAKKDVALEITSETIENDKKRYIEAINTNDYEQVPLEDLDPTKNQKSLISLFHKFKNFLKDSFIKGNHQRLPASTINQSNNSPNTDSSNRAKTKHSSFATSLNPNNPIYDHSTIVPMLNSSEPSTEKIIDVEEEINN